MPSTNDVNEGALRYLCAKPTFSMHHSNTQAVFRWNRTQAFLNAKLDKEDQKYILTEARRIQALFISKKAWVTKIQDDNAKQQWKHTEKETHLKGIVLILSKDQICKLSNPKLLDQIQLHHPHNPNIPLKSTLQKLYIHERHQL